MNIRSKAFFGLDRIKGGRLRSDLENIEFHYFNYFTEDAVKQRARLLSRILEHAILTVPYYKGIKNAELHSFPVVDKNTLRCDYETVLSTQYDKSQLSMVTTSGSTGTPFRIYRDKLKVARHKADNIFISRLSNYEIGERLYYTRVWTNVNKKSRLDQFMMNIAPYEISNLSDQSLKLFINTLQTDSAPKAILGFSTFFEALVAYIENNNTDVPQANVKSIMTMSEHLPEGARTTLEKTFGTKCYSRYSNMENGFIANQFDMGLSYLINHGSYLIEILDLNKDEPVANGELGRIVVTDYFNHAMPFIRYDTGDLGIIETDQKYGPYIKKVEGRKTDFIYNTKKELLSPHTITNTMWEFNDIKQFQFIQYSETNYTVVLNVDGDSYNRVEIMKEKLKNYLGADAQISIKYVNHIPALASGKLKKIVNKMSDPKI